MEEDTLKATDLSKYKLVLWTNERNDQDISILDKLETFIKNGRGFIAA